MTAIKPLYLLIGFNYTKFTKYEYQLLEGGLFIRICAELKEFFRQQYKNYFVSQHYTNEKENSMLDKNFGRLLITDILLTGSYNPQGIANYSDTHQDVIDEIVMGNLQPSSFLLRKIIEIHCSVRNELYKKLMDKLVEEYLLRRKN